MFDKDLYLKEMAEMINKAIERVRSEIPNFNIYTASIWTDPNAATSSINFDSRNNSLKNVVKSNEWNKKYYDQYLADRDLEQAELFKPNEGTRLCNPADFELRDSEESSHNSFPKNWESKTDGECWRELEPALIEIGNETFQKLKDLNLEEGFELSINSDQDWYDKTWQ